MIRVFDLKTKFIQKEAINPDLNVYIIRWDYRPFQEKQDPEQEESPLVDTDYATWVQEIYYHEPTLEEIKNSMLRWCNSEYISRGFYIDGNQCVLSEATISALRIKCEHNSDSTILIPCVGTSMEFDTDTALQILFRINDYYENCKKVKESLISQIKTAESLEALNDLNFNLEFPADVKLISSELSTEVQQISRESETVQQAVMFSRMIINTMSLTDTQSLQVKYLYPEWSSFIGSSLETGIKVLYLDKLYKVITPVNPVQDLDGHRPGEQGSQSMYTEINETNQGTIDDPIPYNNNMELVQGKYYIQLGVIYLCTRNSAQPVYNDLKDLVEIYVEVVE